MRVKPDKPSVCRAKQLVGPYLWHVDQTAKVDAFRSRRYWRISRLAGNQMRILALETSDRAGSIALLEADRVLAERVLASSQRTAQSLAPAAHELIAQLGWQPTDVELVAVASGPGSFTGLRIGITFAKVFAYAVRCQLLGVNTLEAIAARAPGDAARFWAVIDAQRNELFAAEFARDGHGELRFEQETHVVDSDMWLERLSPGSVVTGPALAKLS